ncbi:MAG: glycoside hydrolase family 32 protein [Anaerolineae bacterium]|nr:glycoside hydrolase family 32 protein [Anaerolineae bacterium]
MTYPALPDDLLTRLAADPHRPAYHCLPPAHWMNDPNGLIQWRGQYHLFYQHNPHGPFWGTIHWGHAVSPDLVHWRHLPPALAPDPDGPDRDGVFSGCAFAADGTPTILYTAFNAGVQLPCLAVSYDDLLTWHKHPANPIIQAPPPDLDLVGFRDHSAWREGSQWYQLIGSGLRGVGGTALLYTSADLVHWVYVQPILVGDRDAVEPLWTGSMWECPDLFRLGNRHVLVISVWDERPEWSTTGSELQYAAYLTGDFTAHRFTPLSQGRVDHGRSFYAPQSLTDEQGRRLMFGWLRETRPVAAQIAAGWSGVLSLPRVLSPRDDGRLGMEPAPELERLRRQGPHWRDVAVNELAEAGLAEAQGDALEIGVEAAVGPDSQLRLAVLRSPDGAEETALVYDGPSGVLSLDTTRASLDAAVQGDVSSAPLPLTDGETLRLRVFVDRSVVEVFANGWLCLTSRVYPTRRDSQGVTLSADGEVTLRTLDVWPMNSIHPLHDLRGGKAGHDDHD